MFHSRLHNSFQDLVDGGWNRCFKPSQQLRLYHAKVDSPGQRSGAAAGGLHKTWPPEANTFPNAATERRACSEVLLNCPCPQSFLLEKNTWDLEIVGVSFSGS